MDYPKTMVRTHIRFHQMISGTPLERFWSLDSYGEYLQLDFKLFVSNYSSMSSGEQAFCRFLLSVWDKNHERQEIEQFLLRDLRELDGRYAHTIAQWASDPFWA